MTGLSLELVTESNNLVNHLSNSFCKAWQCVTYFLFQCLDLQKRCREGKLSAMISVMILGESQNFLYRLDFYNYD